MVKLWHENTTLQCCKITIKEDALRKEQLDDPVIDKILSVKETCEDRPLWKDISEGCEDTPSEGS